MQSTRPIRQALLSVSDKSGIVEFAQGLVKRGVKLLSTGGTAKLLEQNGLPVTEVSDYTGFPEMMDGRVKTLHPKVHGGILGRRGTDDAIMQQHGIEGIDMVVVNLYPFAATVAKPNCTLEDAVENIDIGGPTMVRSAAKNHKDVAIVVKNQDFDAIFAEMDQHQNSLTWQTRVCHRKQHHKRRKLGHHVHHAAVIDDISNDFIFLGYRNYGNFCFSFLYIKKDGT